MRSASCRPVRRLHRVLIGGLTAAALTVVVAPTAGAAGRYPGDRDAVEVRVIAFNDLHGNLQPPSGSSGRVTVDAGPAVDAGGAAYLATHIAEQKAEKRNAFVVSSGDSVGASPLASAVFHDEPTIAVLNAVGVKAEAVGNHEFDEGYAELLRLRDGGCHPDDGCDFRPKFRGAKFPILGANVRFDNGRAALKPYTIQRSGGVPVGIIGVTLEDLPSVVLPSGIKGLRFGDEVEAINRTSRLLTRRGVRAQIVLMHQGDVTTSAGGPNACNVAEGGPARVIAESASAQVDAFFTAHSHSQYNCSVTDPAGQPRPFIQGLSFGRLLSVVDLQINRRSRDVMRNKTVAENVIVTRTVTPDPTVQAIVDEAVTKSAPIANRVIGTISADITRTANAAGESALGDVIADAQLAATQSAGAQIAITNPGGIRGDLTYASSPAGEQPGEVTYGDAYTVQPFGNVLQTITLTGADLKNALEQQYQPTGPKVLQISAGFSYSTSASAPVGSRISDLRLNGVPIDPAGTYRVTVNQFLAEGGDGFEAFTNGTDLVAGGIDLDAFVAYLSENAPVAPPPLDRITLLP